MGTRADFYVGRGTEAEWLGSIAWDTSPATAPHFRTWPHGEAAAAWLHQVRRDRFRRSVMTVTTYRTRTRVDWETVAVWTLGVLPGVAIICWLVWAVMGA